jgi:hypothetical protein
LSKKVQPPGSGALAVSAVQSGELFLCSKVAQMNSGCLAVLLTMCMPTSPSVTVLHDLGLASGWICPVTV